MSSFGSQVFTTTELFCSSELSSELPLQPEIRNAIIKLNRYARFKTQTPQNVFLNNAGEASPYAAIGVNQYAATPSNIAVTDYCFPHKNLIVPNFLLIINPLTILPAPHKPHTSYITHYEL
jgi:hypothetical protein